MTADTIRFCCCIYAYFLIASVYSQLDDCALQQLKCFSPVSYDSPPSYHWACCLQSSKSRCPFKTKQLALDAFDRYCPGDTEYRSLCTPRVDSECKRGQLSQFKATPNQGSALPSCDMQQMQCFGHLSGGMYGCCASHDYMKCPPGTQALSGQDFVDPETKESVLFSNSGVSDFAALLCDPAQTATADSTAATKYRICRPTVEWKCDKQKVHDGDRQTLAQLQLAYPSTLSLVACNTRKLECWHNQWSEFAAEIRHPIWACCADAHAAAVAGSANACTKYTQSAAVVLSSRSALELQRLNSRLCAAGGEVCIPKHNAGCSAALQLTDVHPSEAHTKKVYRMQGGGHLSVPKEPSRQNIVDCHKQGKYQCYVSEWELWSKAVGTEPVWLCCASEGSKCPKNSSPETLVKNEIDRGEFDYLVCGEKKQICVPESWSDTHCTKDEAGKLKSISISIGKRLLRPKLKKVQKSESGTFVDTRSSVFSEMIQMLMVDVVFVASICALCCGLMIALVASYVYTRKNDKQSNRYNMIANV